MSVGLWALIGRWGCSGVLKSATFGVFRRLFPNLSNGTLQYFYLYCTVLVVYCHIISKKKTNASRWQRENFYHFTVNPNKRVAYLILIVISVRRMWLTLEYARESERLFRCLWMIWEIEIEWFTVYERDWIDMSFLCLSLECTEE